MFLRKDQEKNIYLKVHAKIGTACLARLGLVDRFVGVTTHCVLKSQTNRSQFELALRDHKYDDQQRSVMPYFSRDFASIIANGRNIYHA